MTRVHFQLIYQFPVLEIWQVGAQSVRKRVLTNHCALGAHVTSQSAVGLALTRNHRAFTIAVNDASLLNAAFYR